jgi:hypothetical protein
MNVALKMNDENLLEAMEPVNESLTFALLEKEGASRSNGPQHLPIKLMVSLLVTGTVCLSVCLWGHLPVS